MNIALIGYGKTGKEVERIAKEQGVSIVAIFDGHHPITNGELKSADVCLDFTVPRVVVENVKKVATLQKNLVVGTTGWYDQLDEVKKVVADAKIGLVFASNFSLGVNIFFHLVRKGAKMMNKFEEYDALIHEIHHKDKADSPSGTALRLGTILLDELERKKSILAGNFDGKIKPEQLHVSSTRAGSFVGKHNVTFDSLADTIELTHTAKNRTGFARGALLAAKWIYGKTGLYTMDDVLADVLR